MISKQINRNYVPTEF